METYLLLAEKARAFRADSEVQEALATSGVLGLATPTLEENETVADLLASPEDFDPEVAAQRNYGFVRLQQLALAHLIS
jgi:xylose isomerase